MAKLKTKAQHTHMNAVWEILEAAEYIGNITSAGNKVTVEDLVLTYRGNFVPMLYDNRLLNDSLKWDLTIEIIYYDENGKECFDKMEWEFNTPMTFKEMLHGNHRMVVKEAGITTVWQGVGHEWTNYVKKNIRGKAKSAWAVAKTSGLVKPFNSNHIYTFLATKLNKDFRTGKYLL